MTLQPNDDELKIRIPKDLKRKFKEKCKSDNIKASEWLRQQVEKFCKEDKQHD